MGFQSVLEHYFRQCGSFHTQLHQIHQRYTHTVGNKNVAQGIQFLVTYSLCWTMHAISAVAELLALFLIYFTCATILLAVLSFRWQKN